MDEKSIIVKYLNINISRYVQNSIFIGTNDAAIKDNIMPSTSFELYFQNPFWCIRKIKQPSAEYNDIYYRIPIQQAISSLYKFKFSIGHIECLLEKAGTDIALKYKQIGQNETEFKTKGKFHVNDTLKIGSTLGTEEGFIKFEDTAISRNHMTIKLMDGCYEITESLSMNGTYLELANCKILAFPIDLKVGGMFIEICQRMQIKPIEELDDRVTDDIKDPNFITTNKISSTNLTLTESDKRERYVQDVMEKYKELKVFDARYLYKLTNGNHIETDSFIENSKKISDDDSFYKGILQTGLSKTLCKIAIICLGEKAEYNTIDGMSQYLLSINKQIQA